MTLQQRLDRFLWPYLCRGWVYVVSTIALAVGPLLCAMSADDYMGRLEFAGRLAFHAACLLCALVVVNSRARYLEWKYRSRWRSS